MIAIKVPAAACLLGPPEQSRKIADCSFVYWPDFRENQGARSSLPINRRFLTDKKAEAALGRTA